MLAGCIPVGGPQVAPAQPAGPILVMIITNDSGEDRMVEYEAETEGSASAGGGQVGCGTTVMEFGAVSGSYELRVEGEDVAAGEVPSGVNPRSYLVFEVAIAEDGSTEVVGPAVAQRVPQQPPLVACP